MNKIANVSTEKITLKLQRLGRAYFAFSRKNHIQETSPTLPITSERCYRQHLGCYSPVLFLLKNSREPAVGVQWKHGGIWICWTSNRVPAKHSLHMVPGTFRKPQDVPFRVCCPTWKTAAGLDLITGFDLDDYRIAFSVRFTLDRQNIERRRPPINVWCSKHVTAPNTVA